MEKLLHERLREDADKWEERNEWEEAQCLREQADEIEKYYIPRPRFEDGEPVQFEDAFSVPNITPDRRCKGIVYLVDGSYKLVDGMLESYRFDDCSRPTPKVCDADGVEIKRNDRMYPIEKKCNSDTEGYIVNHIEVDDGINSPRVYFIDDVGMSWMKADQLTHERPVFDAEGVRICKGDTVYIDPKYAHFVGEAIHDEEGRFFGLDGAMLGEAYEVVRVWPYEDYSRVFLRSDDGINCPSFAITHREPDSLQCPHCGKDLAEGGVVELIGYLQYPNDDGEIPYDNRLSRPLDDTDGYRCAHCGEDLNFNDSDGMIRIFGR